MRMTGYSNPMRGFERSMAPDFAQRQFRDPGLRRGIGMGGGLGSVHTMPHLQRLSGMRLQGGGSLDPVGSMYAASRPNLYNPDPMRRSVLSALRQADSPYNSAFRAMPFSGASFAYAGGGANPPDPEEVMEPGEDQSPEDEHLRDVVLEAMAALEGQHPHPEEALAHFIDIFGPHALADLQAMTERRHESEQQDDEGDEEEEESEQPAPGEDDLGEADGGLLAGDGTGQSDEIQGVTESGRPVLLSDGEYVIDAPTVAALGDGSTSAGARRLDALRKAIRQNAYGHEKQAKPMAKGGAALVVHLG